MTKAIRLVICYLLPIISGCAGATGEKEKEVRIIDAFSQRLERIVRQEDVGAYQELWVKAGDEFRDLLGKPLRIKIPVRDDALQQPGEIKAGFEKGIALISRRLGGKLRKMEVLRVEYLIENGPPAVQAHLFQFEVTLVVKLGDRTCKITQPACVQSQRGIVIGDYFIDSDGASKN